MLQHENCWTLLNKSHFWRKAANYCLVKKLRCLASFHIECIQFSPTYPNVTEQTLNHSKLIFLSKVIGGNFSNLPLPSSMRKFILSSEHMSFAHTRKFCKTERREGQDNFPNVCLLFVIYSSRIKFSVFCTRWNYASSGSEK